MSMSLNDLTKTQLLSEALVVAGANGLWKKVTAVCVTMPGAAAENTENDDFIREELAVTSMDEIRNDPERQRSFISKLSAMGLSGAIVVSQLEENFQPDKRALELANAYDFPLLVIPGVQDGFFCAALVESLGRSIRNAAAEVSASIHLLEYISQMPRAQRTLSAAIYTLADWNQATLILTDSAFKTLEYAAYPHEKTALPNLSRLALPESMAAPMHLPEGLMYRVKLEPDNSPEMNLFVLSRGRLSRDMLRQLADAVRFSVHLWGREFQNSSTTELLQAMLQQEQLKARRLGAVLEINVAAIDTMWIIDPSPRSTESLSDLVTRLRSALHNRPEIVLAEPYDRHLLICTDGPHTLKDMESLKLLISQKMGEGAVLTMFTNLRNTSDTYYYYNLYTRCIRDARTIFPALSCLTGDHIELASRCRSILARGGLTLERAQAPLYFIHSKGADEMVKMLAVYLLDAGKDIGITAELLYLHKNTIKYRLNCLSDDFGLEITQPFTDNRLYQAVALYRLKSNGKTSG